LQADPAAAAELAQSLSPWPHNGRRELEGVKDRLRDFVDTGQLGVFAHGYWGHPAMKLSPEINLLAAAHYLQAIDWQRIPNQVVALLGGKTPHIQNLVVGGVANAINLDNQATLNMTKLYQVRSLLEQTLSFVRDVYLTDVCAVGAMYPEWLGYGAGVTNYLAVPDLPLDSAGTEFDLPGGTIFDGNLASVTPITSFRDEYFRDNVAESIAHAWYEGDWTRHPYDEETVPHHTTFDEKGKYTWVKAPRFSGRPMQVGPLAQMLIGYATGHQPTCRWLDHALGLVRSVSGVDVPLSGLHSTLGRHLARAVRCAVIADLALKHWELLVANIASGDTEIYVEPSFPAGEVRGFGFHEAPRGTLSHWIVIRDGKIANYQAVVPSTWNAGPRDDKGVRGPYEASLVGNPIADPERPLEALRTIHSFDPCLACAIHTLDPRGQELARVKVL
jgi:hydrogenase large subunit